MPITRWLVPLAMLALLPQAQARAGDPVPAQASTAANRPAQVPWDARAVEHLLNRAGFGATPADVDSALALGREEFLRRLFDGFAPATAAFEVETFPRPSMAERRGLDEEQRKELYRERRRADGRQLLEYAGWWVEEMAAARHPLRERMVLFWHGFFTSLAKEVKNGEAMIRQNQLFHAHALGSYADLLHAIVRDPAMLA